MYIEKRRFKNDVKYYLVHSYREKGEVNKIRKYLGLNLSKEELSSKKAAAKEEILRIIQELSTEVFLFSLTRSQIEALNKYNSKIKVFHLNQKEWQKFTDEFVYSTNAIEGSTVQRAEVPIILKKKRAKNEEEIETKGVAKAVEFIKNTKEELSISLILKLHRLCFSGSKPFAGQLRTVEVVVRNSLGEILHHGIPAAEVRSTLQEMVSWYKNNKDKFKPLVLAAIIHNQFEDIHPFQDGNGRVGRLLLNYILLKNNCPPINIALEDRGKYYSSLRDYELMRDIKPTLKFLIEQYKKTLKKVTTKN